MSRPLAAGVTSSLSLEELVRLARAGEAAGIAGLYDRYAAGLSHRIERLTGSSADAEDVVHDVFVGLPEALRRYDDRGQFGAWLGRVTVRTALMRARRDRRRREAPLADAAQAPSAGRADASAEFADVERAIRALPDPLRAVLVLKQLEGYGHDEIAALLGISVVASRARLTRALDGLRRALHAAAR